MRRYTAQAGLLLLAEDLGDMLSAPAAVHPHSRLVRGASCAAATMVSGEHDYLKGWWHGGDADRAHWRLARSNGAASEPAYAVVIEADGG
ncbi:MAG: hypothetical protein ACTHM4_03245 [Rhodanobacteraceae bacterium]